LTLQKECARMHKLQMFNGVHVNKVGNHDN
jgi:hypothetical protein